MVVKHNKYIRDNDNQTNVILVKKKKTHEEEVVLWKHQAANRKPWLLETSPSPGQGTGHNTNYV